MTTLLLCMTFGSALFFILLMDRPYGLQAASAIAYTISVVFLTFGGKNVPPYMFTCPAVRAQLPRLIRRHLGDTG